MQCSSAFDRSYWATLYAILEAREFETQVERALDDGGCPPHFRAIWEAHVREEVASVVANTLERALSTPPLTPEDQARKRSLVATYRTWRSSREEYLRPRCEGCTQRT